MFFDKPNSLYAGKIAERRGVFFAGFGRAGCFGGFGCNVLRRLVLLSVFGGACALPDCKQVSAPDLVGFVLQVGRHKAPRRRRDNNRPIRGFGICLGFGQGFLRKHRRSLLHDARRADRKPSRFRAMGGKPRQAQLRNIRRRRQICRLEFQNAGRQNNGGSEKLPRAVVFGGGRLHFKGNAEPRRNRLNRRRQRLARSRRKPSSILIGIGVVLPGVSGSAIAILVGIYDKVLTVLNDSSIKTLKKIIILFPIIIGIMVGVIIFGNILLKIYEYYEFQMKYIFIGLIFGGVPILVNELKDNGGVLKMKTLIFSVIFSLLLIVIPSVISYDNVSNLNPIKLFIAGILYISGKIIPGISSSFFMMLLGMYERVLLMLSNPFSLSYFEWISFIPFIIGIIVGVIILIKVVNYLFNKHLSLTYSIIIGFVCGSTLSIFPGLEFSFRGILSMIFMLISFLLTNYLSKNKKKIT